MKKRIVYSKYDGIGNDFIITDKILSIDEIKKLCDRNNIGADGVIINQKKDDLPYMNFFNSDGSKATMCGNGIRCFAQYLYDNYNHFDNIKIKTDAGIKEIEFIKLDEETAISIVNMGSCKYFGSEEIIIKNNDEERNFLLYKVNSGTEHIVIFVDNLDYNLLKPYGLKMLYGVIKDFPNGTNVNFVKYINSNEIDIMTFEKGVNDMTLACGTGAVASAYIGNKILKMNKNIIVGNKGGYLKIDLTDINNIKMKGLSKKIFEGETYEEI